MTSLWLIYWLEVLESLQNAIFVIFSVFTIVLVIHGINELTKDSEERKDISVLKKGIIIVRRTQTKDTEGKSRIGDSTKTFSGQRIINWDFGEWKGKIQFHPKDL